MNPRPSVIVDGVTAHTVADCPHPIGSPAGIAWCRKFTWLQSADRDFLRAARAAADDRIEAVTGWRMGEATAAWPPIVVAWGGGDADDTFVSTLTTVDDNGDITHTTRNMKRTAFVDD